MRLTRVTPPSRRRAVRRVRALTASMETLEIRRLLAAEVAVSSEFGGNVADNDTTPSQSKGTDFGTGFVAGQRPFRTWLVGNSSTTDDLVLGNLTVPAGFKVERDLPDVLGPGSSTFITISLLDTAQETRSGDVQFTTNVPGAETFNFAVTGTIAANPPSAENIFENVSLFSDADRISRAEGEDIEGLPTVQVDNQLLRFNVSPANAEVQFTFDAAATLELGATGDAELVVLRDADGDGRLDLAELAQPLKSFIPPLGASGSQTTAALGAGTYFALLRVANFVANNPAAQPPRVDLEYSLDATITPVVQPPDVAVSFGGAAIADDSTTASPANGTDFGAAQTGQPGPQRTFTVTNSGEATLQLGQASAAGAFEIVSGLPATLAGGASWDLVVRMLTNTVGPASGAISFSTNVTGKNPFNFAVAGNVTPAPAPAGEISVSLQSGDPLVDAQPQPVNFGTVVAGQAGAARTFVVRNDGTAVLALGGVTLPAGFELSEPLVTSLDPGASDTFTVTLAASGAPGSRAGTLSISSGDADESPFDVPVQGTVALVGSTAGPDITVLLNDTALAFAQIIDFGAAPLGGPAPERGLTLRNDGTQPLAVGEIALPDGFALVQGFSGALAPGTSAGIRIALATSQAGAKAGQATIITNDADESPFVLGLTGSVGVSAGASLTVRGVAAKVPDIVVAGTRKAKGAVSFQVFNESTTQPLVAPVTFSVLASSDEFAGSADRSLANVTRTLKLKAGRAKTVKLKIAFPADLEPGPKNLLVSATGNGIAAQGVGPTVTVQAPFVHLTGPGAVPALARPLAFGRPARLSVQLQNTGNVPTGRSPATYSVIVTTDGTPATSVFNTAALARIALKPGQSKPQKFSVTFPAGSFAAGSYTLMVRVTAELNDANGQTVALIPFAIA
jgi:hypothetical protein